MSRSAYHLQSIRDVKSLAIGKKPIIDLTTVVAKFSVTGTAVNE